MKIQIYGKTPCSYCDMAKSFLDRKGWQYEYTNLQSLAMSGEEGLKQANTVLQESGMKTVPIVKIDNIYIGGYDQLVAYVEGVEKREV